VGEVQDPAQPVKAIASALDATSIHYPAGSTVLAPRWPYAQGAAPIVPGPTPIRYFPRPNSQGPRHALWRVGRHGIPHAVLEVVAARRLQEEQVCKRVRELLPPLSFPAPPSHAYLRRRRGVLKW
jgi:hypothetical protein